MPASQVLVLAFLIGVTNGFLSMTPPAVVAWAAHLNWLKVSGSPLAFMGSRVTAAIFTVLAVVEIVNDKRPSTPSRLEPPGLTARGVLGGLCGATLAAAGSQSLVLGAALGLVGGIAGAFLGYQARTRLVRALGVSDLVVAGMGDAVTIACSLLIASRF